MTSWIIRYFRSLDVLIFGDSTVAWGVIPEVIEQMSGLKVAMMAFESNLMNAKSMQFLDAIASCYLKDNGKVLLSFSHMMQTKGDPRGIRFTAYAPMIERIITQHKQHRRCFSEDSAVNRVPFLSWMNYKYFQSKTIRGF